MTRSHRAAVLTALATVLVLLVSGCGLLPGGDSGSKSSPTPGPLTPSPVAPSASGSSAASGAAPAALKRFYDQKVTWHGCRGGDRCTRIRVPLDYAKPAGRSITLAVLKVPARDKKARIGSLVVNPGGPGGSGVDYAANASSYFGAPLLRSFDIVGFDPRGVGESTPVQCLSDRQLDAYLASDPDPDTPAETRTSDRMLRQFGQGCLRHSGDLARHVSTVEAARDIDILRQVLGDPKLSYFGASYGTFLGATYADEFPTKVGRMVLDGALDPSVSTVQLNLVQAHGFEVALRSYVKACVDRGGCFLGSTVDQGTQRIRALLASIDKQPLPGDGRRKLAIGNAVLGIWAPLYNRDYWGLLDNALRTAMAGDGSSLLMLSDAYTSRGPNGYPDNSFEALSAVNCLDHDDAVPSSKVKSYLPRFEKASPTFGAIFAYSLSGCAQWPIHSGRKPAPIHAPGSPPILVVGTTRDPATPLVWAQALARQLSEGVLVTRNGDGHTGYLAGNKCVDRTVEAYLVSGTVPKQDVSC